MLRSCPQLSNTLQRSPIPVPAHTIAPCQFSTLEGSILNQKTGFVTVSNELQVNNGVYQFTHSLCDPYCSLHLRSGNVPTASAVYAENAKNEENIFFICSSADFCANKVILASNNINMPSHISHNHLSPHSHRSVGVQMNFAKNGIFSL